MSFLSIWFQQNAIKTIGNDHSMLLLTSWGIGSLNWEILIPDAKNFLKNIYFAYNDLQDKHRHSGAHMFYIDLFQITQLANTKFLGKHYRNKFWFCSACRLKINAQSVQKNQSIWDSIIEEKNFSPKN